MPRAAFGAYAWRHERGWALSTLSATTMTGAGILSLSVELLVEILSYLNHEDLLHCRQVSLEPGHVIACLPHNLSPAAVSLRS